VKHYASVLALLFCAAAAPSGPDDASALAWKTAPGSVVPLNTTLRDELGHDVPLRAIFHGRPVILDLGYYHCPSLCGIAREDLFNAITRSGLVGGVDYTLVTLSIDPAEKPGDAAEAKAADLARTPHADGTDWHYLTGPAAGIEAAVGFRARYDPVLGQFLHPAGLVVLTADGTISSYLLGVGYAPGDLRAAVLRARDGGVARAVLPVLLLCFHYDMATGRYTLAIEKVLRLMALLTVLTLGGLMAVLHRRRT
jgi:protein SCO1/2